MAAPLLLALLLAAAETRTLPAGAASPPATIAQIGWLSGTWAGPGVGGRRAVESYTPAHGGQISGHFEQADGKGGILFYELMQIVPAGGSLTYRLKHFNADLTGWEEKPGATAVTFPLVAIEKDAVHFDGMSFYRKSADTLRVVVRVKEKDGSTHELGFDYRRVAP